MSTDSDDGGSFWTTFGGALGSAAEASPLEQLLQSPESSVEALLDEEEIIQEFKAGNERLVSRLSQPAAAKALLEFVTCEPAEQATSKRCFRYPFVAVELMTCGPDQFFQALVRPEHPEILDTLWIFLEATPPAEVNPVLAGYFSRTAASIFSRHPQEVVEYLRKRGADALLERFLERLHLRSLAELFARLLCAEQPSQAVFPVEGLVTRLLARFKDQGPDSDTQENVTLVLLELLAQKDSVCYGDEILRQLTTSSSVGFLVDHIFSGQLGSVAAATSIISNLVIHTYVALKGISVCASTPTLSPLSPPPLSLVAEEDVVNVGADDSIVGEAAPTKVVHSPPRSPTAPGKAEGPAMWLEARGAQLMREICLQFPRIRGLLDATLDRTASLSLPNGIVNPVGSTTLEVVNLIAMLARTGCAGIFEAMLQEQLLPRCLELFFRHPWSSLLHNAIKLLVSEVLSASDGERPRLVLSLIRDGGLVERLAAEYKEEELELRGGARRRDPRVGYMGQVQAMCCELRDYGMRVPECGAALQAVSGWSDVILPAIDATQRVQAEKLGGGIRAGDRGLASSSGGNELVVASPSLEKGMGAIRSNLDTDFVLDDITGLEPNSDPAGIDGPRSDSGLGASIDYLLDADPHLSHGVSAGAAAEEDGRGTGPIVMPVIGIGGSTGHDPCPPCKAEWPAVETTSNSWSPSEKSWADHFEANFGPAQAGVPVSGIAAAQQGSRPHAELMGVNGAIEQSVANTFWDADFSKAPANPVAPVTAHTDLSVSMSGARSPGRASSLPVGLGATQAAAAPMDALPVPTSSESFADRTTGGLAGGATTSSSAPPVHHEASFQGTATASLQWSADFQSAAVATAGVATACSPAWAPSFSQDAFADALPTPNKSLAEGPPAVGTENLFALLGEDVQAGQQASASFQMQSPGINLQWDAGPPSGASAPAQPSQLGGPMRGVCFDAFAGSGRTEVAASQGSAPRVDISCLADFDPLFQPSTDLGVASGHGSRSNGGDIRADSGTPLNLLQDVTGHHPSSGTPLSGTDLASLAPLWPSQMGESSDVS